MSYCFNLQFMLLMKWNISSMISLICISTFVLILSLFCIKILYLSVICFIIIKKSVVECSPPPLLMEYTALQSVLNLSIKGEKYSPCTEQLYSCCLLHISENLYPVILSMELQFLSNRGNC